MQVEIEGDEEMARRGGQCLDLQIMKMYDLFYTTKELCLGSDS